MSATISGWNPEIERSFKEVLFRFLEEVQSTKASLYLLAVDGSYRLATQYGFRKRDLLSTEHVVQDPLVKKVRELRNLPLIVNDPNDFPEIADYLEGAGTARLLLVPLYGGSRVLGFVDARDKGRKRLFEETDAQAALGIADGFLELIRQAAMYEGYGTPARTGTSAGGVRHDTSAAEAGPGDTTSGEQLAPLDMAGLQKLHDLVFALAKQHDVAAVALTAVSEDEAATLLMVGERSAEVDVEAVQRHQSTILRDAGMRVPELGRWRCELRRVEKVGSTTRNRIVVTAPVLLAPAWGLVASVVGVSGSAVAADAMDTLQQEALWLQTSAENTVLRRKLARRLLSPGQRDYPELEAHSAAVSQLCWRMARELHLDEQQVEEAALAGLLHDVGMRELDYDRLYRHASPGPEERQVYRQHVTVGETITAGAGLLVVSQAVRHHHERWDGSGYPDRLPGVAIPRLARLVHVAEVFDVLTAAHSYRQPVGVQRALSIIKKASAQQFDPEMVDLLARVVE